MYKHLYSRFLNSDRERLHFAAHSHHPWPDETRDAQLRYWDDAALLIDRKWDKIFSEIIPEAQRHISRILHLSEPGLIAFAPNTHEFVVRLFSCFEPGKPVAVLTSDGEFHSFRRQLERLEELPHMRVVRVPTEPCDTFEERFLSAAAAENFDLIYVSQVFFSSGCAVADLPAFVRSLGDGQRIIVIDGYHGFCALPTDLSSIEQRIFYIAGGYKYAQAGEGACFMHVPRGCTLRPISTGWFASYGSLPLTQSKGVVPYSDDAFRFWGATFDPSGLYRFNAAMQLFDREGLSVAASLGYVRGLQEKFLSHVADAAHPEIRLETLTRRPRAPHGRFFSFKTPRAPALHEALLSENVITDVRGDRLRFGFGIYQDQTDIELLFKKIARVR